MDIEKRLGTFQLHVRFETGAGPLALLGASGSGKSRTLQCIAGIVRPDRGRIVLDGRVLFDSEAGIDLPPQKRRVGYLFQSYALFPNMTVRQNLLAGAHRLSRVERARTVDELTVLLELEGLEELRPAQLSGGQRQRVALGRILASRPAAILLDEPLAALDSFLRWQVEPELARMLRGFGGPVVWVSHDAGEIRRRCASVCVIDRGWTEPVVTTDELFASPQTVAAAKVTGCKNFTPLEARGTHVFLPAWGVELDCGRPVPPEATVVGVHSRDIGPQYTQDRFVCRVEETVMDTDAVVVLARTPGGALLRMELGEAQWAPFASCAQIAVGIPGERVLLLRQAT